MNLKKLLTALQKYEAGGTVDLDITGLSYDSRKTKKGHLFFALPGVHHHGLEFLAQAEKAGAAAVLSDRRAQRSSIPQIVVENPRLAMALLSSAYFGHPSRKLRLFGVTGTNGKTTSTFLLRSVLETAGIRTGLLGTVSYSGQQFQFPSKLTTPESLDLQELLADMAKEGSQACAMEVSSHSLAQHRVSGCTLESALFTNLTQDHLDYHETMEQYFAAKKMLFDNNTVNLKIAVINRDDPYGRRLIEERQMNGLAVANYGFGRGCQFKVKKWITTTAGSQIVMRYQNHDCRVKTPLLAKYNAYNIAGVYAAATLAGVEREHIVKGIAAMTHIPGRLERVDYGQPFLIFIDYAHTEDALRQLLITIRHYTNDRLIVLFGAGGERDRGKRPLMGRAAGELADEVILTSDNPRHEDPLEIIQQVKAGIAESGNTNVHVFVDRKEAIAEAIRMARPGDLLILAGKGHEDYQVIGDEKLHFSEREILKELLR